MIPSRPRTEESFRFLTLASWSRRLRSRPCLCKSSCLCSRCRSIYIHPCPCKNSDPCKRAFLSPSCRLAPDRTARQLSSQVEDSKLESLRWYPQANLRALHQLLEPSWTLSFPELPPVEFGLQPLLLLLTPSGRIRMSVWVGFVKLTGPVPSPGETRGSAAGSILQ
jgi:hypothetical protein